MFNPLDYILKGAQGVINGGKNALNSFLTAPDNSTTGIIKNTITGLPTAAKKVAETAKEFIAPTRGYSETELRKAKPTIKDTVIGAGKGIAEISTGLGQLGDTVLNSSPYYRSAIDMLSKTKVGNKLADTSQALSDYSIPNTVEEAKAMRVFDIASNVLPVGKTKNLGVTFKTIADSKDVTTISKELLNLGVKKEAIPSLAPKLVDITNPKTISDIVSSELYKPNLVQEAITAAEQKGKGLPVLQPTVKPATIDPLITETKKYKSAEEFVNSRIGKEKVDSNFRRSNIDTVYHNTSPQSARNIVFADTVNDGLNVSTLPELALGQGGQGATIEFSTRRLDGGKIQKPGADFIEATQGKYPEYSLRNAPSKLTPDVKSVTFDQPLSSKGEQNFFGNQQNWKDTKQILPDGKVKYSNPNYKDQSQLTDIWNKAKTPTPEAPVSKGLPVLQPAVKPTSEIPTTFNPEKYVTEQVAKREAARVAETPTILGKAKSFLANAKAKLVDATAPIEDTLYQAQKKSKFSLLPEDNITNQIDRVLRTPTLAGQFAKDNGIVDVIKGVDNIDNLDQYLIAKHAVELDAKGIKTGRDLVKDQSLVQSFAPKYEETAKVISQYSKKLLDYSVESGLISKDLAVKLKEMYPDYVPMQRVFNELEQSSQSVGGKGVASLSKQTAVQKIVGSEREIESPIESLLSKTNDVFKQGEKNLAGKMLAGYEKLPGNPFGLKLLEEGEKAPHTISFFDDGVKKTYSTTPEIAQAAKSLNVQQLNILGKIFALPVRMARLGLTGINLPFIATNVIRDQSTGFINSSNALRTSLLNPENFTKPLFEAVGHGKLYQEMVRAGGAGTTYDLARNQVAQTVDRIRSGKSLASKALYTVKHPSELLRAVEDIVGRSEELTRIQQYNGTKKALLAQGMDEKNAIIGAAKAARENTVNFARRGEWGTVLNSAFLYLNASIQGTRTFLRAMKTRPAQTFGKVVVSSMFPVATITTWNLSDPERKKAYEDIPEYEKQNNIIIIPPNPTKDEQGKWNVIKIPLSQEINNIVSLARRPIEAASGLDPLKFKDFSDAILGTVSPIDPNIGSIMSTAIPQAIKPSAEGYANTNFFTGYPQVPYSLEKLSPEKQIKKDTSDIAITMGQKLGVSPIKIDAFIKGTFGGVGEQLTGKQNVIDAITARFSKAAGGATDNQDVNDLKDVLMKQADNSAALKLEAQSKYDELKKLPKEEANARAAELKQSNPALFNKLKDVVTAEKLGLSYKEKQIMMLGVENGERANYIQTKLSELKTSEEKNAYVNDLKSKKIITDRVFAQLKQLNNK